MIREPKAFILSCVGLGLLWFVLTDGESASWLVGMPVVFAAAWLRMRLGGVYIRLRLRNLPAFALFFLRYSIKGGWDVAKRVFSGLSELHTKLVPYETQLAEGPARILLINCISLMPGTAVVERDEGHLQLHVLDSRQPFEMEIRRFELHIAQLFNSPIPSPPFPAQ